MFKLNALPSHLFLACAVAVALLSGCSKPSTESNTGVENNTGPKTAAAAQTEQRPGVTAATSLERSSSDASIQSELNTALEFVKSRLSRKLLKTGSSWEPSIEKMDRSWWRWREVQTSIIPGYYSEVTEVYSAQPSKLAVPVKVEGSNVQVECLLEKCFQVEVTRRSSPTEPAVASAPEFRAENTWYFASPEEAMRVANALTDALKASGAQPHRY